MNDYEKCIDEAHSFINKPQLTLLCHCFPYINLFVVDPTISTLPIFGAARPFLSLSLSLSNT